MNISSSVVVNQIIRVLTYYFSSTADVKPRTSFNFSFSMHPRVAQIIKDVGVDAVNLGNNHQADRNMQGWLDTKMNLERVGIRYFGAGLTTEEQAEPLMIDAGDGANVGITSFMDGGYCCDEVPVVKGNVIEYHSLTLRPQMAPMAVSLLEQRGATVKIAFPHWLGNYVAEVDNHVRHEATNIANAGYDLIVGSDGSHTVKEFAYVKADNKHVPCFYDIGNFVFQKWGRFRTLPNGKKVLPYGTVTHVILEHGKLDRLEIVCTLIDNNRVHYQPRPCNAEEAAELFSSMGPHLQYRTGDSFATINLAKKKANVIYKKPA